VSKQYDHYSIDIQWSVEDEVYVATVPELPGCQAEGKTHLEAARRVQDAIATWIHGNRQLGLPIPPPRLWTNE
jgi:antitoxin HicB